MIAFGLQDEVACGSQTPLLGGSCLGKERARTFPTLHPRTEFSLFGAV
jgi:hypothetical protein